MPVKSVNPGKMHSVQVVASIANEAAGPSYSVPQLSAALARCNTEVDLIALGNGSESMSAENVNYIACRQDFSATPMLSQLRLSGDMRRTLNRKAETADIFHTHGLWLMSNVYPAWAAKKAGKAFVLSPRGMLGAPAMQFSRLKKQAFWLALQHRALKSAALLHATSEVEFQEIRAAGLKNPVAIIRNGIDVPELKKETSSQERMVLALGRVHPKKGLDQLIHAWSRLGNQSAGWKLRIIGPSEDNHAEQLQKLAAGLGLSNVSIEAPLYGSEKLETYRQADLFVLPTLNENFALTVAEALAAGTPVISTKGAPWAGLSEHGCGWWIDHGVESMSAALANAMVCPRQALNQMGSRGRDWMLKDYSWDHVGQEMFMAYQWLTMKTEMPDSIKANDFS